MVAPDADGALSGPVFLREWRAIRMNRYGKRAFWKRLVNSPCEVRKNGFPVSGEAYDFGKIT